MTTIILKPFTKSDLDMYAGVEGGCPLIATLQGTTLHGVTYDYDVIVDDAGINIQTSLDVEHDGFYNLELNHKASQKLVKLMDPTIYKTSANSLDLTAVDMMAADFGMQWVGV